MSPATPVQDFIARQDEYERVMDRAIADRLAAVEQATAHRIAWSRGGNPFMPAPINLNIDDDLAAARNSRSMTLDMAILIHILRRVDPTGNPAPAPPEPTPPATPGVTINVNQPATPTTPPTG